MKPTFVLVLVFIFVNLCTNCGQTPPSAPPKTIQFPPPPPPPPVSAKLDPLVNKFKEYKLKKEKEGLYSFSSTGEEIGYIKEEEIILPPLFSSYGDFGDNKKILEIFGKRGVYDLESKSWFISPSYETLSWIGFEDYYFVKNYIKFGLINKDNRIVLPLIYDQRGRIFKEVGLLEIGRKKEFNLKYGIFSVDKERLLLPCEYEQIIQIADSLFEATNGIQKEQYQLTEAGTFQLVNTSIEEMKPYEKKLGNGVLLERNSRGLYQITSSSGNTTLPYKYTEIEHGQHYHRLRVKAGKTCLIDWNTAKEILPCEFDYIDMSSNPHIVMKNGKWGIYSREGKEIISSLYDTLMTTQPTYFTSSKKRRGAPNYIAKLKNAYFVIDELGLRKSPKFPYLEAPTYVREDSVHIYYKDPKGKLGIINETGQVTVKAQFQKITYFNQKHFIFKKNNKYGMYSFSKDSIMVTPQYDFIINKSQSKGKNAFIGCIKNECFLIDPITGSTTSIQSNPF